MQLVLLAFGIVSMLVGAGVLYGAARMLARRRTMARMETSPTGAVGPGPVEVFGRAGVAPGGKLVASRFAEGQGVVGVWRVEELRRSGKSNRWVTLLEERESPPIAVDDGTGPILLDLDGADLDVDPTYTVESRMGRDPPPRVLAFLQERDLRFEGAFGVNRRMRFTETLLATGQPLYVLGIAELSPTGGRARYVVRSGTRRVPFLVATRSEREVARRTLWKAAGLAGAALLFLGVGATMAYSGWTTP